MGCLTLQMPRYCAISLTNSATHRFYEILTGKGSGFIDKMIKPVTVSGSESTRPGTNSAPESTRPVCFILFDKELFGTVFVYI